MSENPDSRPEPMVIDTFEGEYVRLMRGKIPSITVDMPEGFVRGTHVHMQVEARVRGVGYPEATDKEHKGQLVREHTFVVEEVVLLGSATANESDPGVGGSAAAPRVTEVDSFGAVIQDCWYDPSDLTLHHRGGCDVCYRRVPESVVMATVTSGGVAPTTDPEVGF